MKKVRESIIDTKFSITQKLIAASVMPPKISVFYRKKRKKKYRKKKKEDNELIHRFILQDHILLYSTDDSGGRV